MFKEEITLFCKNCYELAEQLDQLKAKNETLKQYNASKQASYESMQREWNNAILENRELHKTLTEIKEIIHFNKTNRLSGGTCISIEQILQKISEVECGN